MDQLPLIGGSYATRSVIANAQRCVNLFPEANRGDSPTKFTHYQRPGLVPLVSPSAPDIGRGLFQASNGDCYAIIGQTVYFVSPSWTLTSLGGIGPPENTNICSMVDNGIQIVIVNGALYAGNATGTVLWAANPTVGNTVTFNGVTFTFIAGPTSGTNIQIGGSVGLTIGANLLNALTSSVNPLITAGYYSATTVGGGTEIQIVNKTAGAAGTAYSLATTGSGVVSAATLLLGTVFPGQGYTVALGSLAGGAVTRIVDVAWLGADRVDYIDTFIIGNQPGTRNFWSTTSNTVIPFDPLYIGGKTGWADPMQTLAVNQGDIFLPGTMKGEIWYDAGSTQFPFARLPGTSTEHGIAAKYSISSADLNIYWLSKDLQGQGIVLRMRSHDVKRISNYALEFALRQLYANGISISDAVGYVYQQDGHLFYVLNFPSGNQTWVFDESVGDPELAWTQRGWTDGNGTLNRDRGLLGANFYGKNVVLDWENGTIYEQSLTTYVDTLQTKSGATTLTQDYPITYLRTFPHLMSGLDPASGQPALANGKVVQHEKFMLDVEVGTSTALGVPQFSLRWSDDRGKTWGNAVLQSAGEPGKYLTRPTWPGTGQAVDRVYEVSWNFPGQVAINGAWVQGKVLG